MGKQGRGGVATVAEEEDPRGGVFEDVWHLACGTDIGRGEESRMHNVGRELLCGVVHNHGVNTCKHMQQPHRRQALPEPHRIER